MSASRRNLVLAMLLVYIFSALLIGLTWYQVSVQSDRDYENELQSVWRESTSMVRAFEDHVRRILRNTEHGMRLISRNNMPFQRMTDDFLKDAFFNMTFAAQIRSVSLYSFNGTRQATTNPSLTLSAATVNKHLNFHEKQSFSQLFIDIPFRDPSDSGFLIPISYPIAPQRDTAEGIAVVLIPSESFSNFFRQTHLGHDKLLVMVGDDGVIRARQYRNNTDVGQDWNSSQLFLEELPKSSSGRFHSVATVDSISRFFSYVGMIDYPLILLVGVTESEFMTAFEERKMAYYHSALTVTLIVFWFSVLLTWLLYRQHHVQNVLRESNELLSFLHSSALDIMNRRDVVNLLETIIDKGVQITGAASGNVMLFNEERTERIRVVSTGVASDLVGTRSPIDSGAAGEVWKTGKLVLINDYMNWPNRIQPASGVATSVVCFPLKSADEVVGVIGLWHTEPGQIFSPNDVSKIEKLSRLASIAFENAYLYREAQREISDRKLIEERLQHQSFHDSLTGLYNRTYFEEEMLRQDKRRDGPASLFVFDVDGLKLINDTLGHDRGDKLLNEAGSLLLHCFRDSDMVARIGGDEFAALLPDTDEATAKQVCERIHRQIEEWNALQDKEILSLSVGFSSSSHPGVTMRDLFKRADDSMYREKLHRRQSTRSAIVQTVMKLLEARDFITEGHAERMQDMVVRMGRDLGYSESKLADLRLFAQFHDVGKVGIPDRILMKAGPLDADEKTEMQRHCEIGYRIAQSAPDLLPIAEWILKHQEWWNGEGYPLGVGGEDIPLECRILSIVDAYDAMTSDRPYRNALSTEVAIAELRRCSGTQFEPTMVERFIRLL